MSSTPVPAASGRDRGRRNGRDLLPLLVATTTEHAIFVLDADGVVVTWNPGAERLKGYAADEIIGRHFAVFYPEEDVVSGKPEQELAIAVADGHSEDEGLRVRSDGTTFWANSVITALRGEDGSLLGFGKITQDLTARKRGEELLRDSEERFRLLVHSVSDYAIFLLDPTGIVTSWNLGAERLKGYRADEILGHHFSQFYAQDDRRSDVPGAALRVALTEGRFESEGWRVRKDGSRFWANVVITALWGADGRHRGFAKVTKDLTSRKRNEDALRGVLERERQAAAKLRQIDRLRSEVVEVVAHDLRAPLGVIQNLVHLLTSGWHTLDDTAKLDQLNRIAARADTMSSLVDDVFDVARIDAGDLDVHSEIFDVGAVVANVVADVLATPNAVRLILHCDGDVTAIGDPRRAWQVVSNLVSNAVKFSPADAAVQVAVSRWSDHVSVAVTDNGPGIPREEQHLLFQRFSRLTGSHTVAGSGLGLYIAKALAVAQNGDIDVVSTLGAGATFTFTLPIPP